MRRVSVVGPSGSGKTTLARAVAERLDVPFVELDAIHHLPGWTPIDPDEFRRRLEELTVGDAWVVDGNYGAVVRDGPVWERADTVVWLDLSRSDVMRQLVGRTLGRLVRREVLWNGNREHWTNLFRWDPEVSIVRWAWTTHASVRERYERLLGPGAVTGFRVVRLRDRAAIEAFLARVPRAPSASEGSTGDSPIRSALARSRPRGDHDHRTCRSSTGSGGSTSTEERTTGP